MMARSHELDNLLITMPYIVLILFPCGSVIVHIIQITLHFLAMSDVFPTPIKRDIN